MTPDISKTVWERTLSTLVESSPSMIVLAGPLPVIVKCLTTSSAPLDKPPENNTIGLPSSAGSKTISSPIAASEIARRSEPGPLSLVLVTVMIAADA